MEIIVLVLIVWLLIGPMIFIRNRFSNFKNFNLFRGVIIDWARHKTESGSILYSPIVRYSEEEKKDVVLENENLAFRLYPKKTKIWIIIDGNGKAFALVSKCMELLLSISMMILGVILLLKLQLGDD